MTDYIERQAVLDAIYLVDPENDGSDGCTVVTQNLVLSSADIESIVSEIPAANVREDVQGRWEIIESEFFTCSVCGDSYYNGAESSAQAESYLNSGHVYKFCPNCGARMVTNNASLA